jgi:hypothetical protein
MKTVFPILVAMAVSAAASAAAPFWTAICRGETDANYTQTIGADGVFNTANSDGTYVSWPIRQTVYRPGEIVCGAVSGSEKVAQVCADNLRQVIILKLRDSNNPKAPLKPVDYCRALVKIH